MTYRGTASACGAATVINAIATWKGGAFAVGLRTWAEVELGEDLKDINGKIEGGGDPGLIELCVQKVLELEGQDLGGVVSTRSEVPFASGLKSSSAAANATVLATLAALGVEMDLLEAVKIGVEAAREAGVTITGAFDDACASALGGLVFTDNEELRLVDRREIDYEVLLLVPDQQAYSAQTNVENSKAIAPLVDVAWNLAMIGDYELAMTLNGFLYCGALGFSAEPMIEALKLGIRGTSLSGTGPSYAAIGDQENLDELEIIWRGSGGKVIRTEVDNTGARIEDENEKS